MAYTNWMLFVDGENFTLQGQKVARKESVTLVEGRNYKKDCFVWYPGWSAKGVLATNLSSVQLEPHALRAYYYASAVGDETLLNDVTRRLWELEFSPQVFKRQKGQEKSKGVDISLCKDVLSHAFQGHYDAAVLIAGDGDYVPLVEQVKRLGKLVHIWFFRNEGLNPSLELAADAFYDLTQGFLATWTEANNRGFAA